MKLKEALRIKGIPFKLSKFIPCSYQTVMNWKNDHFSPTAYFKPRINDFFKMKEIDVELE